MTRKPDNSDPDEIGDITREQILLAWDDGMNLKQISDRVQLPVGTVNRSLKHSLQTIIRHGAKNGQKKTF